MPIILKFLASIVPWLLGFLFARAVVRWIVGVLCLIVALGYLVPEGQVLPVAGMKRNSYDQQSFWYSPWGASGVHHGVDIFAAKGTQVVSATGGWVIYTGTTELGGETVMVLGPSWRVHSYSHLSRIDATRWQPIAKGWKLGAVGATGNAKGKPAHLHYSIYTPIPYVWQIDWKKPYWHSQPFYINPTPRLNALLPTGPDRR